MEISFRHLILIFTVLFSWATVARSVVDGDRPSLTQKNPPPSVVAETIDRLTKCAQQLFPNSLLDQGALFNRYAQPGQRLEVKQLCFDKTKILVVDIPKRFDSALSDALKEKAAASRTSIAIVETGDEGSGAGSR
jgi:hypothetical protein